MVRQPQCQGNEGKRRRARSRRGEHGAARDVKVAYPVYPAFRIDHAQARVGANSGYYIMGELAANEEKTRAFAIDSSGRYVLRVGVSGVEGTQFKIEFGGSAYQTN